MIKPKPLFIIFLLFFVACEDKKPEGVIDEQTYKNMFIELAIVNQYDHNLLEEGTTRDDLRQKVYQHYGVSEEVFAISHEYYENNLDEQLERLERINEIIREEREKITEAEELYREQNRESVDSLRYRLLNR
jgi:hypothetical protein